MVLPVMYPLITSFNFFNLFYLSMCSIHIFVFLEWSSLWLELNDWVYKDSHCIHLESQLHIDEKDWCSANRQSITSTFDTCGILAISFLEQMNRNNGNYCQAWWECDAHRLHHAVFVLDVLWLVVCDFSTTSTLVACTAAQGPWFLSRWSTR